MVVLLACSRAPTPPAPPPARPLGSIDGQSLYEERDGGFLVIADGGVVMKKSDGGWQPLATGGRRIQLDDGSYWVSLGFAAGAEEARAHWISPAHGQDEIAARRRELEEEAARLPPQLRARVQPALSLMALISTLEGRFADPATHRDDSAASLGIFQWATERKGVHAAGTTLGRFFSTLAKRAAGGDEPLYKDAWKQCQKLGVTISGGDILVKKKRLTGGELEARLGGEMGRGALRSYQLVAALDWIDDVRGTVVRPGVRGAGAIGHDYAEAEHGRMITLKRDGHTLELRPDAVATVGDFFHGERALATAVSLGVNRPRYVEAALWQAYTQLGDVQGRVDALLQQIAGPPGETRWRKKDLTSLDAYDELVRLLWPAPPAAVDEAALERAFTERALALYRPEERSRRARRLATNLLQAAP
jgi:hypothetical protein